MKNASIKFKISEVEKSGSYIEENLNEDNLYAILDELSESKDISIELVEETDGVVYSKYSFRDSSIQKMPYVEKMRILEEARDNGGELLLFYSPNFLPKDGTYNDENFKPKDSSPGKGALKSIIYTKIVSDNDGDSYAILINAMINPVDATVNTLRVQLYYVTGFIILFSIILSLLISRKVSKPIEKINDSAKILSLGD
jgi:hypothetical protein